MLFDKNKIREKLLSNISIDVNTQCWLWTGKLHHTGYAFIEIYDKSYSIHRLSLWIYKDFSMISDLDVLHSCPNKHCMNPEHLREGTASENMLDSVIQGTHFQASKTECPQGHEYTTENTKYTREGKRYCRECRRIRAADKRARELWRPSSWKRTLEDK